MGVVDTDVGGVLGCHAAICESGTERGDDGRLLAVGDDHRPRAVEPDEQGNLVVVTASDESTAPSHVHHRRLPRSWRWIDRWVIDSTEVLVFVVGTMFTVLVSLEVVSRYVFNFSIFLVNSAARFLLVWFFLLGAGLALREGAHVGLELLLTRLSPRERQLARVTAQGLVLVFCLVMFWSGYRTLGPASHQMEGALGISLVWVMLAFPVGFLLLIYHQVTILVATMRRPPAGNNTP